MIELLKILSLIIILIIFIRLKLSVYLSVFIVSLIFILLYKVNLDIVIASLKNIIFSYSNINLILAVILITFFGEVLSSNGNFKNTFILFSSKFKELKYTLAIIPALIGLIPMPGGALFSAPMVEEGGKIINLNQEEKHHINYVFRHIWEFFWPTYPAILLINNFFKISIKNIIYNQVLYSIIYVIIALIIFIFPIKNKRTIKEIEKKSLYKNTNIRFNNFFINSINYFKNSFLFLFFINFWPIIVLLIILIAFETNINFIVSIILIIFFIVNKIKPNVILSNFKKSFSLSTILTIISIIFFKELITISDVLKILPKILTSLSVNPFIIVALPPFLIGFLTGLTVASVGVTFPILKTFYFSGSNLIYSLIMISVISGFWGVMLSPVHLCLSLTREYFKTSYKNVYIKLLLFFILNFSISILLYFAGYPPIIKF
ncbi:MAG: DUF401 family protein [Spirochaetes bacterium]|nr:DUF401 family protein [Spirochaetota bacterium]